MARLSERQRGWLLRAARDAAVQSTSLKLNDQPRVREGCDSGSRFANASSSDMAALRRAATPVYAQLERHPATNAFIDQIQQIKTTTPTGDALHIPADCTAH